jgi:hypothetical protein
VPCGDGGGSGPSRTWARLAKPLIEDLRHEQDEEQLAVQLPNERPDQLERQERQYNKQQPAPMRHRFIVMAPPNADWDMDVAARSPATAKILRSPRSGGNDMITFMSETGTEADLVLMGLRGQPDSSSSSRG